MSVTPFNKSRRKKVPAHSPVTDAAEQELADQADDLEPTRAYQTMPVVGLGGSAGSIQALRSFFERTPPDSGIAFVVILHLSPDHESALAELLQRTTSMRVTQVRTSEPLVANCVYVIPPGKALASLDGRLDLEDLPEQRGSRYAIDLFFRTLADTHGPQAMAVVLSGADGDGSIGIKRIKERGGLTVAQDPAQAEYDSMPRSAIATGMVDWVLKVEDIPHRLIEYRNREQQIQLRPDDDAPARPRHKADRDEAALREVLDYLRVRTGRDFLSYKRNTVARRIARRMQVVGVDDLTSYLDHMRIHAGETGVLLNDLLITVTNFFRDPDAFEALDSVIGQLFSQRDPAQPLRAWVPGCATGEEAYSIAMLLLEHGSRAEHPPLIQVFACDLDDNALRVARIGFYPETIEADVRPDRLRRWFSREAAGYRVRREVRETVLFSPHDLLVDTPFARMDLVSCRNLLIYLTRQTQQRAFQIFHFALKPGGVLFLGLSETVDEDATLFNVADKKYRIYRRRDATRPVLPVPIGPSAAVREMRQRALEPPPMVPGPALARTAESPGHNVRTAESPLRSKGARQSWADVHLRILERAAPPSVVINSDYEVLHVSESAGRFMAIGRGEPSTNLLKMVQPALRVELRAALARASKSGQLADTGPVTVDIGDTRRAVVARVLPGNDIAPNVMLVLFDAHAPSLAGKEQRSGRSKSLMQQLDSEVDLLRGQLRDTIEQYEGSSEELKASNEELQAMNEELRAASEELETSREELQSINEELSAVNHELKAKVDELASANSDLYNLMSATPTPTIFLDRELRIMRYTPAAVRLFNLIPGDLGRPLSDLRHRLEYSELIGDAEQVLSSLVPVERQVRGRDEWYLVRVHPYRTLDDRIGGVVMTFTEVTEHKRTEEAMRQSEARYRALFSSIDEAFAVLEPEAETTDADFCLVEVNPAFRRWAGIDDAVGKTVRQALPQFADLWTAQLRETLRTREARHFEHPAPNDRWHDVFISYVEGGGKPRLAMLITDITERRQADAALRDSQQRLRLIVDNARDYAIVAMDIDRRIDSWNVGAEVLTGYRANEVIGSSADLIFTEEDRAKGAPAQEARTALTSGRAVDERWHVRKNGSRFWGSGSMAPMVDQTGATIGLIKIFRDETRAREAAEALERSRQELLSTLRDNQFARAEAEAAGRAKDHFLAVLSHELRTPLTPVLMAVQTLAMRDDLPDAARTALAVIRRNVLLESRFIDDLLDLTRIVRGKLEIVREPMDLHEAVRAAIEICEGDTQAKGQTLQVALRAAHHHILGDSSRLQQAVWNILKNASKFTPAGGQIRVTTDNEDRQIRLVVTDTGIGIDADRLPTIFDAFTQGGEWVARDYGGLGLGLAICKATVDAHDGKLRAESGGRGHGATLVMTLPLFAEEGQART